MTKKEKNIKGNGTDKTEQTDTIALTGKVSKGNMMLLLVY